VVHGSSCCEKAGGPFDKLSLNVMSDCINEYIARGNYIFPPAASLRLSIDLAEYVFRAAPKTSFVIGCGYPIAESGATLTHAAALMLASGLLNIDRLLERGLAIDDIAPRVGFNIHVGLDFFPEIAKFRALRRLWARIMKEKIRRKASQFFALQVWARHGRLRAHRTAAGKQHYQGYGCCNVRCAWWGPFTQRFFFDEALAIPTEKSAHIALATQQILAYETGIPDVVDPLGGSYYVETLTDRIEKEILDYLGEIDNQGGLMKAIETGWVRREIALSAYTKQKEIDSGQRIVVGVNKFVSGEKPSYQIHRADPAAGKEMIRRVQNLRKERDNAAVQRSLEKLREAARGKANLVPILSMRWRAMQLSKTSAMPLSVFSVDGNRPS